MAGDSSVRETRLFGQLEAMRIEEPGASRSFEEALADENGWSRGRAEAIAAEYRRFLYLAATSGREVTPSRFVDKAWHLHLTYTRHYWDVLCGRILGRPLHHRPSFGGTVETEQYRRQYEDTLALYEATFGTPPPPSAWPRRPGPARSRKPRAPASAAGMAWLWWLAAALSLSSIAAAAAGPPGFLAAAAICLAGFAVARSLRVERRRHARSAASACGGGGDGAYFDSSGWTGDCGGTGGGAGCGGGGCGGD